MKSRDIGGLVIALLLVVALGVSVYFNVKLDTENLELKTAYASLERSNQQLQAENQQLRFAIQQASEQQSQRNSGGIDLGGLLKFGLGLLVPGLGR